eukprot:gnl/TRDRNA2_/TRDRNA2_35427_c0_seq1.p1 gnl/TRDRNA2_/TRDRNA2_35427_c0~~gnl/TRDRNA2_/TRDRNA2_35427_c0_seq1.p1  ORF type:complete len:488 (+),score=58.98 gnl/TRDRNA2_/TRDRNA2_35427_c0_seq1:2-1465(+)
MMSNILRIHGIDDYSQHCNLCPGQRGFTEHVPGPQHYDRLQEIVRELGNGPVVRIRERLWQEWEVCSRGVRGILRFNHLDGAVELMRSPAPPAIPPPHDGGSWAVPAPPPMMSAASPSVAQGAEAALNGAMSGPAIPAALVSAAAGSVASMPEAAARPGGPQSVLDDPETWPIIMPPVSCPTAVDGEVHAYPHFANKDQWKKDMGPNVARAAQILAAAGVWPGGEECKCGMNLNSFEEHILGQPHYKNLKYKLDGQPVRHVHRLWWLRWMLRDGSHIAFNHIDGTVAQLTGAPTLQSQTAPPPRPVAAAPPPPVSPPAAAEELRAPPPPSSAPPLPGAGAPPPLVGEPEPQPDWIDEETLASFHMKVGDNAEVCIEGCWVRVVLKARAGSVSAKAWTVEEFWGGRRHTLRLKDVEIWQEGLPSYRFEEGQSVSYHPRGQNTARLATARRRGLLPDGRKGWHVQMQGVAYEILAPLEDVLEVTDELHL